MLVVPRAADQPGARRARRRHGRLRQPDEHDYLTDPRTARRAARPAIIESIRAGLVFQLKEAVGVAVIRARGGLPPARGRAWQQEPDIEILGNLTAGRLSIVSFMVRARRALPPPQLRRRGAQRPLRHPGPRRLLVRRPLRPRPARHRPRTLARVRARDRAGLRGHQARLGAVNFNYFISEPVADYVIEAVRLVARDGWRLLGDYDFDATSGLWRHQDGPVEPPLRLRQVYYDRWGLRYPRQNDRAGETDLERYLGRGAADLQAHGPSPTRADAQPRHPV